MSKIQRQILSLIGVYVGGMQHTVNDKNFAISLNYEFFVENEVKMNDFKILIPDIVLCHPKISDQLKILEFDHI